MLSLMGSNNRTLEAIQAEVEKCEVVCILCHRHRTHMRGKNPLMTPEQEKVVEQWWSGTDGLITGLDTPPIGINS